MVVGGGKGITAFWCVDRNNGKSKSPLLGEEIGLCLRERVDLG